MKLGRVHLAVGAFAAAALPVVMSLPAVLAWADTSPSASQEGTSANAPSTITDPPLTPYVTVPLSTGSGSIQAVIYDGANTTTSAGLQQALSGFTVPSSPFTADATAIVADGQLPGNTFTFAGSGTQLTDSNAFPGADPHPTGWSYGGLWDTRNYNVTSTVNTGDSSVNDTVAGPSGDCLTSVAQVFATGPTAAFASAGYVAAGVALRNQGSGTITVSGVPAGASVKNAYLIWANINPTDPGEAMDINGSSVTGATVGTDASPCWANGNIYTHSADVTPFVTGNGTYSLSGYATGATGGGDPWGTSVVAPLMEGASLVVFYSAGATKALQSSKYTYCAGRTQPDTSTGYIGRTDLNFNPCMTVTDEYNGTTAISQSILSPASSTGHGGCPPLLYSLEQSLVCQFTGSSHHSSGSGVVDQVTMKLFWTETIVISEAQFGVCDILEYQGDTMTMSVTTSATGARHVASSNTVTYGPPPDEECG